MCFPRRLESKTNLLINLALGDLWAATYRLILVWEPLTWFSKIGDSQPRRTVHTHTYTHTYTHCAWTPSNVCTHF